MTVGTVQDPGGIVEVVRRQTVGARGSPIGYLTQVEVLPCFALFETKYIRDGVKVRDTRTPPLNPNPYSGH